MQSEAAPVLKDSTLEAIIVEDYFQFRWLRATYSRSVWPV